MKTLIYTYRKVDNYYSVEIESSDTSIYNNLGENDLFLKEVKGNNILKIRVKNKYPFVRVLFKPLIPSEIWFGKFPNSDDLIIFKMTENNESFNIYIKENHWKYRFLFLGIINTNPEILSSYNKPI
jgi:hypothetical protein